MRKRTKHRCAWCRALVAGLLSVLALVAIALATSGWWLGPAMAQVVWQRSGRALTADSVHIGLNGALQPVVHFRGLHIENASWADRPRFVDAGEVRFTFAWRSLIERRVVVDRLDLIDADVDLERLADGTRNWRLHEPGYRGPGRIRIAALNAMNSRVRFAHRGDGLDVHAAIAPLEPSDADAGRAVLPLSKRLALQGSRAGQAFEGDFAVSDELTFLDTGRRFAARGVASSKGTTLHFDGTLADAAKLGEVEGHVDGHVVLAGPSLAELATPLKRALPASRPYRLQADVRKSGAQTDLSALRAQMGSSLVSGEVLRIVMPEDQGAAASTSTSKARASKRVRFEAKLRAKHLDWSDIASMRFGGATQDIFGGLRRFDAKLDLAADELAAPIPVALHDLALTATLDDGLLEIESLEARGAGGAMSAHATLDARSTDAQARFDADVQGVRLERILLHQNDTAKVTGNLQGHVELATHGSAYAQLLNNLEGSGAAAAGDATIANRLDARLALNGGRLLRTMLEGAEQVPVQTASAQWQVHGGKLRVQRLVLETDRVKVVGTGNVDLANRSLSLTFMPHRKQAAVLALERSIRVSGPMADARIALGEPVEP